MEKFVVDDFESFDKVVDNFANNQLEQVQSNLF